MKNILHSPEQTVHIHDKCSLILRLWRVEQPENRSWRASLEIPEAGRRFGFSSLEQLFAFLIDFTETNCDPQQMRDA